MWNIKERQLLPVRPWTFHVFWLSDMCASNFSPRAQTVRALQVATSQHQWNWHNEGYKEAQGAVQHSTEFNGSLTLNWRYVITRLERVVWKELLIASYSLREWHKDYPFLQYKATEAGDFLYLVDLTKQSIYSGVSERWLYMLWNA